MKPTLNQSSAIDIFTSLLSARDRGGQLKSLTLYAGDYGRRQGTHMLDFPDLALPEPVKISCCLRPNRTSDPDSDHPDSEIAECDGGTQ